MLRREVEIALELARLLFGDEPTRHAFWTRLPPLRYLQGVRLCAARIEGRMILEGIVTSVSSSGEVNIAPMGPIVDESMNELLLRPYKTSKTYLNLREKPQGVLHVTDDVLILARAAIGELEPMPTLVPAEKVSGWVLESTCRWYEFEIDALDDSQDRTQIRARVVHRGRLRDFFGFNRAKHAVVEAAILATRVHLLPREQILSDFERLRIPVQKTAGPAETEAFELLTRYVSRVLDPAPES